METGFPKLSKTRLADQVSEVIYNKIANNEIRPGERLPSEAELSEQLGVGRPTVREALSKLMGLGLIYKGDYYITVAENVNSSVQSGLAPLLLVNWEIRELYEARIQIECNLISLAVRKATAENILKLHEINNKMQDVVLNGKKYWESDMEFHSYIATISANEVMKSISKVINKMFQRYENKIQELYDLQSETYDTHLKLIDAIEKGDEQTAKEITVQALSRSEKALQELMHTEM